MPAITRLGPYDIEKTLGRGGMGTVYAAVDRTTGQRVAVKVLSATFADDERLRGRFATEIETLKRLRHPNIVQILGYGEQDGHLYYSMELVDGRSLFDELRAGRQFTCREVCQIGIQICAALRHAHDRGVIHRDIKPGNLLMDRQGHVKLSDFGIAKLFGGSHLTTDGGVIGTADYMSPEQAQGRPATIRSDLYSLGSVLYALLARRPPFSSKSLPETIKNLTSEKPPPIIELAPNIPKELAEIIDRLLEKDPQRRIGMAQSLANRLKAIATEAEESTVPSAPATSEDDFEVAVQPGSLAVTVDAQRTPIPDTAASLRPTADLPPDEASRTPKPGTRTAIPPTVSDTRLDTAVGGESGGPAAEGTFTVVDERERQRAEQLEGAEAPRGLVWPYVVALVVIIGLAIAGYFFATAPPSADGLYNQIVAASQQGVDGLAGVEPQLEEFVQRFPGDGRVEQVKQYLTLVRSTKYPRRLRQRVRLHGAESLLPCQRDYLRALRTAETDPEAAVVQLNELLAIYGALANPPAGTRECVAAARQQLKTLRRVVEQYVAEHQAIAEQCLARAEALAQQEPDEAATILQALIKRYAGRPWAAEVVRQARQQLEKLDDRPAAAAASSSAAKPSGP